MVTPVSALLLLAQVQIPEPAWSWDVLVWDMSEPSTWIGAGHDYVEALTTPGGDLLVCAVTDAYTDSLKLFSSVDGGSSWALRYMLTSSWTLDDPEMYVSTSAGEDYLHILLVSSGDGTSDVIIGLKLLLPYLKVIELIEIPWNQAGMDSLRSVTAAWDPVTGAHRLFADDDSGNLYMATSTDGLAWSDPALLITNASRPVADAGPGGRFHVAYQGTVIGDIHCATISGAGLVDAILGEGAPDACPCPAAEWTGGETVAVAWHDASGQVILSVSEDHGSNWGTPAQAGSGAYPCIEVAQGSTSALMAYIDSGTGLVRVVSAPDLSSLPGGEGSVRGGVQPCPECPPVVCQGDLPTSQVLFYLGQEREDIWFDAALYTGIPDGETGGMRLEISPNPSAGSFTASYAIPPGGPAAALGIYSVDGRLVDSVLDSGDPEGAACFGGDLPAGVYILRLSSGDASLSRRVVRL